MASFSASGVAADGKLYFSSENGDVFVVKAGLDFEILSTNSMNDICMATPAISEGVLYFRTQHYLVAVSDK
jgi:outer membrane protein assembly factor BamB